jgi:hypothetical protein
MYDDIKVNTKIQDPKFYKEFSKEWEEVTAKLRQIHEGSLNNKSKEQKEIFRPTSSSVVFK